MTYDSSAWTGRRPNPWWSVMFVSRHLDVVFGWDFQRDWFGLRIALGAVRSLQEGYSRYRYERFFAFWPRHSHYRRLA